MLLSLDRTWSYTLLETFWLGEGYGESCAVNGNLIVKLYILELKTNRMNNYGISWAGNFSVCLFWVFCLVAVWPGQVIIFFYISTVIPKEANFLKLKASLLVFSQRWILTLKMQKSFQLYYCTNLAFPGSGGDRSVVTLHAPCKQWNKAKAKEMPRWGALSSRYGIRLKRVSGKRKEPCLHLHLKTGMNPPFMSKETKGSMERGREGGRKKRKRKEG